MEAIILAGGFGTRLRGVVDDLPKPMSPIGNTPFLTLLMDWFIGCGVRRFILSVGYLAHKIIDHYGDDYRGAEIVYAIETTPLGTGGGIREALRMAQNRDLLIANGDSILLADFAQLLCHHQIHHSPVTLALRSAEKFDRYGSVEHHNGIVTAFKEKQYTEKGEFNAGVYAVNRRALLDYMAPMATRFSFEEEVLNSPALEKRCCCFNDYFIDIGIPEDFRRAQTELIHEMNGKK